MNRILDHNSIGLEMGVGSRGGGRTEEGVGAMKGEWRVDGWKVSLAVPPDHNVCAYIHNTYCPRMHRSMGLSAVVCAHVCTYLHTQC